VLSRIEKLLTSYYEVKEDEGQMSHAPGTTAAPGGQSISAPSMQCITGTNRRRVDGVEQEGMECKRMKVDNAVDDKAGSAAVAVTQIGKEMFLNAAGSDLSERVSLEERDLRTDKALESVVHNGILQTDGSETASNEWAVTGNMCIDGSLNSDCRFANRENDIVPSAGYSDTNVPVAYLKEQEDNGKVGSHFHCDELMLGSSKEHGCGRESTSVVVDWNLTNDDGLEVGIQGADRGGSNINNTGTLNKSDLTANIVQKTHTHIASSSEEPAQIVLEELAQGDDLNAFLSSDFDEELECCASNSSSTVSVPNDRCSVNQNTGKTNPVLGAVPPPGSGENVCGDADFAVTWSKGLLKGPNGKVMQVN
jgi:hypothetical protein